LKFGILVGIYAY